VQCSTPWQSVNDTGDPYDPDAEPEHPATNELTLQDSMRVKPRANEALRGTEAG
jgi:hypothetical protein